MAQACLIWSPVVIAEMNSPQKINKQVVYAIEENFYSMEDIKVKTKNSLVKKQGRAIEANIVVDIICLLADAEGNMHLISREEIIREKVALTEFNKVLDIEEQIEFWLNVNKLDYEGDFSAGEIVITLFLDYVIVATKNQIIRLIQGNEGEITKESIDEVLQKLEKEISNMEKDNYILRKKVFIYERNISSLKRGITKAERKNAVLNKEIGQYQAEVNELYIKLKQKETQGRTDASDWANRLATNGKQENKYASQAKKIKRLFLDSR